MQLKRIIFTSWISANCKEIVNNIHKPVFHNILVTTYDQLHKPLLNMTIKPLG